MWRALGRPAMGRGRLLVQDHTTNGIPDSAVKLLKSVPTFLQSSDAGTLIDLSVEEQIHREVYIAILNSALREVGSKSQLARQLGISRAYLSFLLHPDPRTSYSFRRPSLRIADAMSRALPVEPEVRVALREHMQQAHMAHIRRQRVSAEDCSDGAITSRIAELRRLHSEATFASASRGRGGRIIASRGAAEVPIPGARRLASVGASAYLNCV